MSGDEPRLSIAGHLEELRWRLAVCAAALALGTGLGWAQMARLLEWLKRPAAEQLPRFAFFSPAEPLLAYLKVAVLAGAVVAMPVLLWQLWAFVRPALAPRQRWLGLTFIGWGSALFLAGAAFAYAFLLPVSLRVLLSIGQGVLEPVISIDRYLSFVATLLFWCGLLFELPAVLVLLARAGIVTAEWLRQQRPLAILGLVVLAALVTPTTDPITLLLMAAPLWLLYEGALAATRLLERRRRIRGA
ncbi:MAG: twin-arginine translocase subunit TatC [Candidatus Omnitrophica bacterium]|nr:twin-arginine translocase subunit TatC [Candidatus Omnitrophota bacterium]